MRTIVSTNAQVFTETSRSTNAHEPVPEVQPIAWIAGVAVPPAALQHHYRCQHALRVQEARISELHHAALLLRSLLRSERLHWPEVQATFESVPGNLLARRLIDHSGR